MMIAAVASQRRRAAALRILRGRRRISYLSALLRLDNVLRRVRRAKTVVSSESEHDNRMDGGSLHGADGLGMCDAGNQGGDRPDAPGGARHDSARTGWRR